jgi:putative ABC transport system ATP-binding protein
MMLFKNLNVWRGNNLVLRNIDGLIEEGDFVVVVGTNGAGKSTFFDTIAGTLKPNSGTIDLDGIAITECNEQKRACWISRLFQNINLNTVGNLTVLQNLALAHYKGRRASLKDGLSSLSMTDAENIIGQLGMDASMLNKLMKDLSGGQRQLIAFAMATQSIPKILLLDEPTAALDPQAATRLLAHAVQWVEKHRVTTLLITHDPELALKVGNKIWVLQDGKIVKKFDAEQKKHLGPDDLVGKIDYTQITKVPE